MSNLTDVEQIIDQHRSNADQAFNDLQDIVGSLASIGAVIPGSIDPPVGVTAPDYVPYLSPDLDLWNSYGAEFDRIFAELSEWLKGLRDSFLETFFPEITRLLATESDDWLIGVIRDGDTGIPPAVQNAIFERGRERVLKEAQRGKDEARNAWAAMGYTIPSAVLIDQIERYDQSAQDKIGELNRDLTIKVMDVQLDMVKFAIDKVITLRTTVVSALSDYLRAFAVAPQAAADVATRRNDAKKMLWDASVRYFSALVDFKRIEAEINIAKSNSSAAQAKIDVDALQANLQRQLVASDSAAKTYGNLVAAAMSGLNSVVTNAYQATAQE